MFESFHKVSSPRSALGFLQKITSVLGLQELRIMGGAELQFRQACLKFDSTGSCDFSFLVLILLVAAPDQKNLSYVIQSAFREREGERGRERESLKLFCVSLCSKRKQCEVPLCAEFIHSLVHPCRLFGNIFPVNRLSSGI